MFQIAPNCSLTPRGAALFFGEHLPGLVLDCAATLALMGMWPILPFAGLEMLVLGWALHASLAAAALSQTIL